MGENDGHRERLRQRYLTGGLDGLPDEQVLELLLFYALPRKDTKPLAKKLLAHFGSLTATLEAGYEELSKVDGIGPSAAMLISMITPLSRRYMLGKNVKGQIMDTTQACGQYLVPYFHGLTTEHVYMMCLDARCKLIECKLLEQGTVTSASFSIRKAVEHAMSCRAASIVIAHNHPAGFAGPSDADYVMTRHLQRALEPLEIVLSDHIIVADTDFYSMADHGFFDLDFDFEDRYNTFEP